MVSRISFQPSCRPDVDQLSTQVATRPWVRAEASVQWGAGEQAGTGPKRPGWVFSALSPWSPPTRQLTAWEQNSPSSTQSPRPSEPTPSPLTAVGHPPTPADIVLFNFIVRKFKGTPGSSHQVLRLQDGFSSSLANEAGAASSAQNLAGYSGVTKGDCPWLTHLSSEHFSRALHCSFIRCGLLLSYQVLDSVSEEARQQPPSRDALTPPLPTQVHSSVPWATDIQSADAASH